MREHKHCLISRQNCSTCGVEVCFECSEVVLNIIEKEANRWRANGLHQQAEMIEYCLGLLEKEISGGNNE